MISSNTIRRHIQRLATPFRVTLFTLIFLLIFAETNYLNNKHIFFTPLSFNQVLFSSLSLFLFLLFIPTNFPRTWLRHFAIVIKATLVSALFMALFFEAATIDFSGMLFGPDVIYHFSWESFIIGLKDYGWAFVLLLIFIVLTALLFVKTVLPMTPKTQITYLTITAVILAFNFKSTVVSRMIEGWNEYNTLQEITAVGADNLKPFNQLGLQALKTTKNDIIAEPGNEKNVIVIYLESFSSLFTESDRYPDLTPNLNRLKENHFEITPYISNSHFTMDGLISSMCGFIPNMSAGNNSMAQGEKHYFGIPCYSDVLKAAGYHQEFIGGAKKSFAGKSEFLLDHGFDRVWGWEDFESLPEFQGKNKSSWWGLHDEDLFAFAEQQIKAAYGKKPFNINILTLGTHLKGYASPKCKPYAESDDRFITAINCTDQLMGEFIAKLESQGILEDTVIYVTGDHVVFDTPYTQKLFGHDISDKYLYGVIIDKTKPEVMPESLYDLGPVVLQLLEINHNANFVLGKAETTPEGRNILTRNHVYKKGIKQDVNKTCDMEKLSEKISQCTITQAIMAIYGYTQTFSRDSRQKYHTNSQINLVLGADSKHLNQVYLDNNLLNSKFRRQGFVLKATDFSTHGLFLLQFDNEKLITTKYFSLKHNKDSWKHALNNIKNSKVKSQLIFSIGKAIDQAKLTVNPELTQHFECINDHVCIMGLELETLKNTETHSQIILNL